MKFGETLKQNLIPEWASQYIDYDSLKEIIDEVILERNNERGSKLLAEQFQHKFNQYLAQVHGFYHAMLQRQTDLVTELEGYLSQNVPKTHMKKFNSLMTKNCQEIFKSLEMLKSFGATNATGFKKIYKKYKKNAVIDLAIDVDRELQEAEFNNTEVVEDVEHRIERVFCVIHKIDDTTKARKLLFSYHVGQQDEIKNRGRHLLTIGMLIGFFFFIFLAFMQLVFWHNLYLHLPAEVNIMFRVMFVAAALMMCVGMMLQVFESKRINYIFILELPPSQVASGFRYVYLLAFFWIVLFSMIGLLLITSYDNELTVPLPLGWLVNSVGRIFTPLAWAATLLFILSVLIFVEFLRILSGRAYLSRFIAIIFFKLMTPWKHHVTFPLFFTADILTSMTGMVSDYINLLCLHKAPQWILFIAVNIPTCIRACQCILKYREKRQAYPHLANFAKYVVSIPSNISKFTELYETRVAFITLNVIKFLEISYKTYWDIFQDFGCFSGGFGGRTFRDNPEKWKHPFLCRRPSSFSIFDICLIIFIDVVLRYIFLLTAIKDELKDSLTVVGILQCLELLRRFVWAFLRLDNQQATNCEDYLTTNFVPILLPERERRKASNPIAKDDESPMLEQGLTRLNRADTMAISPATYDAIKEAIDEEEKSE